MTTNKSVLAVCALVATGMIASCGSKNTSDSSSEPRVFHTQPIMALTAVPNLEAQPETIRPELADILCVHAYKLPLKSDFTSELGVLCTDGKPNNTLKQLDKLAKIQGDNPTSVQISLTQKGEYTEGVFAAVYAVKILPKWVREGQIQKYMTTPSVFEYVVLDGRVAKDLNADVGGDLRFAHYELFYKSETHTPDGNSFSNERTTDFNAYQVQGGNPDIGLGAEHLTSGADYQVFNTVTVTIGDQLGGSQLITIIRVSVKNNGYPEVAASLISDTATAQAKNVHDGLLSELVPYITP